MLSQKFVNLRSPKNSTSAVCRGDDRPPALTKCLRSSSRRAPLFGHSARILPHAVVKRLRARCSLASASSANASATALGDAAIEFAAISELAFDDAKHVLDLRAQLAEGADPRALTSCETVEP